VPDLLNQLSFLLQRVDWRTALDLALVTLVIFGMLLLVRDTQAMVLLRGVILIAIALSLLTTLINLPAFSWLIKTILPALLVAIPVIFAPELRRGLERVGRAGSTSMARRAGPAADEAMQKTVRAVVSACARLSARQHGALIVLQRDDNLGEYIQTGVQLNAQVTPELLLQIFYPNTPLHDGAAIIVDNHITAAACVLPLSASGILNRSPERQMGLRHRAGIGISEASDAVAIVVSEETGSISIAHSGRIIRRLDSERLENVLLAFYRPGRTSNIWRAFVKWLGLSPSERRKER